MGNCLATSKTKTIEEFNYRSCIEGIVPNLKQSKLVSKQQLEEGLLSLSILYNNSKKNDMFVFHKEDYSIEFKRKDTTLIKRWKLLIFCTGIDMYKPNDFGLENVRSHSAFHNIEKDLHRTFSEIQTFQIPENFSKLSRILKNISLYFPSIGYTQGINFIVGFFLICGFSEEEAFWFFVYLSTNEKFMLMGIFEDQFPLAFLYTELLFSLIQKNMPDLLKKVTQLDLPKETWVLHWFLTYFIIQFPLDVCKMFWDFILVTGGIGTVYVAYSILEQLQDDILQIEEGYEFIKYFENLKNREFLNKKINFTKLFKRAKSMQWTPEKLAAEVRKKSEKKNFYTEFYSKYHERDFINTQMNSYVLNLEKERQLYFNPNCNMHLLKKSISSLKRSNPVYYYMLMRDPKNTQTVQKGKIWKALSKSTIAPTRINIISGIQQYIPKRESLYQVKQLVDLESYHKNQDVNILLSQEISTSGVQLFSLSVRKLTTE